MKQYLQSLALFFLFIAVSDAATAGETNYFCILCGKGPLHGRIWVTKWGKVCDDCYRLPDHCSLCGLPIRSGDGSIKTGDGRLICKFDKTNAVLDAAEAREVFSETRREIVELYGQSFALNYPEVAVNLFDVDYWSEAGRSDGLHKFGFSHTRKSAGGDCTHEVVMLSGRLRTELAATSAHEYTHLWINENRPVEHVIDGDTTEAICELSAYKLMQSQMRSERMQDILDNPYTHGVIKKMVALEREKGVGYILNWVRSGTTTNLDTEATSLRIPLSTRPPTYAKIPPALPKKIKFEGLLTLGQTRRAVICGHSFAVGDIQNVKLRGRTVQVHCLQIGDGEVMLQLEGKPQTVKLKLNEEISVP